MLIKSWTTRKQVKNKVALSWDRFWTNMPKVIWNWAFPLIWTNLWIWSRCLSTALSSTSMSNLLIWRGYSNKWVTLSKMGISSKQIWSWWAWSRSRWKIRKICLYAFWLRCRGDLASSLCQCWFFRGSYSWWQTCSKTNILAQMTKSRANTSLKSKDLTLSKR